MNPRVLRPAEQIRGLASNHSWHPTRVRRVRASVRLAARLGSVMHDFVATVKLQAQFDLWAQVAGFGPSLSRIFRLSLVQ